MIVEIHCEVLNSSSQCQIDSIFLGTFCRLAVPMSESDVNGGHKEYELEATTLQLEVESEPLQAFQVW